MNFNYMPNQSNISPETPSSVVAAIERCLKPIAKLCIHFGLDYRKMSELLKAAFVSVAEEEFKVKGKSQTDSRIALLTGVHRKDVRRLLGRMPEKSPHKQQGLIANLIAQWLGTPELRADDGSTKPIPRNPSPEFPISFYSIAESITNDIHPRALLDECIQRGVVKLTNDGMIHLVTESLIPSDNLDEKAHFFAQTIHDHIAAAEHNLYGGTPAFLDRFVWHEGLTESDIKIIEAAANKAAMSALKKVNNCAVSFKQLNHKEQTQSEFRIHFGIFFYSCRNARPEVKSESLD